MADWIVVVLVCASILFVVGVAMTLNGRYRR